MAILKKGNPQDIDELVDNLFGSPLTHGFGQGAEVMNDLKTRAAARMHVGAITLDRFYRLAEAVGAIRVKSAEHGQRTIVVEDIDSIMGNIEDAIGAELPSSRQCGSLFGLRIRGSVYSERHFDGMYAAWRLRELMRDQHIDSPSLIEIGGGAGLLTFYAKQLGFDRVKIIDLPHTAIVQYLVLSTEFGADQVAFGAPPPSGIGLVRPEGVSAKHFAGWSAVVNVDALPEMPPNAAQGYLSLIRHGQLFLSINQESGISNGDHTQNIVFDVACKSGLVRKARILSWLRTGYVEELYTRV